MHRFQDDPRHADGVSEQFGQIEDAGDCETGALGSNGFDQALGFGKREAADAV
ncbi:hypothetical protein [Sphingomonas desiccabilis]|uniref:hypothetical protein n=1 Tax=Sphingomonas desiccabilis TaxID=429134 RepID=UPI0016199860|nr:hypothetical protein [Sphingomonas desiccabilis]